MAWLQVKVIVGAETIDNIINVDSIVRIGPNYPGSCYIHTIDGQSVSIAEDFNQLVKSIFKAKE